MSTENTEQVAEPTQEETARSIEDRLSKEFEQAEPQKKAKGPDTPDDPDNAGAADGDGLEEVEYEGETFRVPPKLKEAIITKGDYTRGKQEVAESRRSIELQAEQIRLHGLNREFEQTIAEPLNNLNLIESRTKLLLSNWDKLSADEKQEILYLDKQKEQFVKIIESEKQKFDQSLQKSLGELKTKALDAVKKAIPNWNDKLQKDVTDHAISEGYTNQELSSITDPRHIKTLWKAREYDRFKSQATAKPNEVKVVKPGASNPMPKAVQNNLTFRKEMNKATTATQKARLIEERFAKQFGG